MHPSLLWAVDDNVLRSSQASDTTLVYERDACMLSVQDDVIPATQVSANLFVEKRQQQDCEAASDVVFMVESPKRGNTAQTASL